MKTATLKFKQSQTVDGETSACKNDLYDTDEEARAAAVAAIAPGAVRDIGNLKYKDRSRWTVEYRAVSVEVEDEDEDGFCTCCRFMGEWRLHWHQGGREWATSWNSVTKCEC